MGAQIIGYRAAVKLPVCGCTLRLCRKLRANGQCQNSRFLTLCQPFCHITAGNGKISIAKCYDIAIIALNRFFPPEYCRLYQFPEFAKQFRVIGAAFMGCDKTFCIKRDMKFLQMLYSYNSK